MKKTIECEVLIIRIVFCVISLMGCVWHVIDISHIYFSYETTVNVQFKREVVVEMPAITLCTNISYVTRYEYLKDRYANELSNTTDTDKNKWIFGEYLWKLSLEEQLMSGTIDSANFFNSCTVMKPMGKAFTKLKLQKIYYLNLQKLQNVVNN